MLAGELALAGIDVAIVERRASQDLPGSRAGGLHSRTIEVLDQRGIADRFLSQGQVAQVAGFSMIPLDISDFLARPAVPPEHSAGRDQPVRPQPSGQVPDQRGQDGAVGPVQAEPRLGAAQDGDLVPQHQQFRVSSTPMSGQAGQPAAEPDEDQIEQTEGHG